MDQAIKRALLASVMALPFSPAAAQEAARETPVITETVEDQRRPEGGPESEATQDIVVTGSLIRGLPREYLASPVFSSTQADIVGSGAGSFSEYALTIPQNFTGDMSEFGSTGAGINSPLGDAATYNQFDGFAGFALRGLASDATLTLLNGRRVASAGLTESPTISVVPSMLIERVDVIPDGASATYGADAVAGVVNIVTRKPTRGLELQVRGGTATEVGKTDYQASALAGHSWGSGSVYGMASYQKRAPYIEEPVDASGYLYQTTQLPAEKLSGFYLGGQQDVGNLTFLVDASRFQRDRQAIRNYPGLSGQNRTYESRITGYSIANTVRWQGAGSTSIDLNVDYSRNHNRSITTTGTRPSTIRNETNTLFVAELRGQTALATLPAGPILAAAGLQYRAEKLRTDATIFFNRNGGIRKAKSVFGELNVPVVGPGQDVPGVRSLTLSVAGRYEDLGFDSALAPKVGLRWQVDKSVALRGTYARSFLVPRFRDTIGIAEQVSFGVYDYAFLDSPDQNANYPTGSALVMYRAGANPNLKTQKADTFTIGVDFTPTFVPNLVVKAGYYHIHIAGRVGKPTPEDSLSVRDLQTFNVQSPSLAQVQQVLNNNDVALSFTEVPSINDGDLTVFDDPSQIPASLLSQVQLIADIRSQNFAVETTDGLDVDFSYRTGFAGGAANVHVSGQYILNLGLKAGGSTAISRLDGYAKPSDLRLNGTVSWARDWFSLGSVVNYVDGFTDDRAGRPVSKVGSYTTASLFLGFDLGRVSSAPWLAGGQLQLVAANVFNQQPPRLANALVGFDPYNNPPTPRTIGIILTKRFGG